MELTQKLSDAINEQINAEMWSSNLYLSIAVYFMNAGLDGCAHWMKKQSAEEMEHAYKLIDYAIKRGGKVVIDQVNSVPNEWESPEIVFEKVYEHECHVSELIDRLTDVAASENDKATQEFLRCFVNEQVEEEENVKKILDQFRNFGAYGLYAVNENLSRR